jgi:hypothetical protein
MSWQGIMSWITGARAEAAAVEASAPTKVVGLFDVMMDRVKARTANHPLALRAEQSIQGLVDCYGPGLVADVEAAAIAYLATKGILLPPPATASVPAAM